GVAVVVAVPVAVGPSLVVAPVRASPVVEGGRANPVPRVDHAARSVPIEVGGEVRTDGWPRAVADAGAGVDAGTVAHAGAGWGARGVGEGGAVAESRSAVDAGAIAESRPGGKCRRATAAGTCSGPACGGARPPATPRSPAGEGRGAPAHSSGGRGPLSRSGA